MVRPLHLLVDLTEKDIMASLHAAAGMEIEAPNLHASTDRRPWVSKLSVRFSDLLSSAR